MAIDPNVPAIANALTGAVDSWNGFISNQRDWSAGTANGGPLSDGYYPLTNSLGITYSLPSPAKLVTLTTGPMSQAVSIQNDVANAKAIVLTQANTVALNLSYAVSNALAAAGSAGTASTWAANALAQANLAITARTTAQAASNAAVAANTTVAANLATSQGVLTLVQAANTVVQQAKTDTGNYAAQAAAQAATVNPTAIYGAITSNVATLNGSITSNVSTLNTSIGLKADSTALTNGLALKAPITNPVFTSDATVNNRLISSSGTATNGFIHYQTAGPADSKYYRSYSYSNTLAFDFVNDAYTTASTWLTVNRSGYSPTAINFTGTAMNFNGSAVMTPYQGINTGFSAWRQNTLNVDGTLGDGLLNLSSNADHARISNATATGHIAVTTGRGATRLGLHDSVLNIYVANSVSLTAGQQITWLNPLSISATSAYFTVQPSYNGVNLATTNDVTAATVARSKGLTTADPGIGAGGAWVASNKLWFADGTGGYYAWSNNNFDPNTKANLSGAQFTGTANITGAAGSNRLWGVQTAGNQRWMWGTDAAGESGSNAGSNWSLYSYADNGSFIGTPIFVARSTGAVTMSGAVTAGNLSVTGSAVFPNSVQVGGTANTGFYADGSNISIRGYATGSIYFEKAGGASAYGVWNSTGLQVLTPLSVSGNVTATGSLLVGASGGVFVSGQNYRMHFDGAGGTRANIRSDHATAVGMSMFTNDGSFRGAMYYDGSLGFLNQNNNWRLRTSNTYLSIYSDAGTEYQIYGQHNFNPAGKMDVAGGTFTGQVSSNSNFRALNTGGTGQFTAVSGSTMAGFYNDGTTFYVLKSATSNTTFDGNRPLYVSLSTGSVILDGTGAGGVNTGGVLNVGTNLNVGLGIIAQGTISSAQYGVVGTTRADTGYGVRIKARSGDGQGGLQFTNSAESAEWAKLYSNGPGDLHSSGGFTVDGEAYFASWMRSNNFGSGWYHQQGTGGWYMSDTTWMRCYGDKNIVTAGTVQMGAFTVTSDARLKSGIMPLTGSGALIDATNVYEFTKGGQRQYGVLAQEVQQTAPLLVHEGADLFADGSPILTVDSMGYVYALIDTVKDLRARLARAGL